MSAIDIPQTRLVILLVEDHDDTCRVLKHLLQEEGYVVHAAASKRDALDAFRRDGCHLLLSDIGLPDGNGWQLLQELHAAGHAPRAIAMSGLGTAADIAASHDAGFSQHLIKPVRWEVLAALLRELAGERRRRASHPAPPDTRPADRPG